MRTFIAVEIPDRFRHEAADLARLLSTSMRGRFIPRENYHVTLAFLGELDEMEAHAAIAALDEACQGVHPLSLCPEGLGRFGRAEDATLWLGIAPSAELVALADDLRAALAAHGIAYDQKQFRPHVTLARRVRIPRRDFPGLPFPREARAERITLFKSILDAEGASYKPLYSVNLQE